VSEEPSPIWPTEAEYSNTEVERPLPENVPLPDDEDPDIPSLMIGIPSLEEMSDIESNVDGLLSNMANELLDSLLTSFARMVIAILQ
jgi:hypothetical protein